MRRSPRVLSFAPGIGALAALLSGCSNTPICSCPAIISSKAYYVGSFVSGEQSPPVQFTGVGETATITFQAFKNNQPAPLAPVLGTPNGICSAAALQVVSAPGEIVVKSTKSGTCAFSISSSGESETITVNVP